MPPRQWQQTPGCCAATQYSLNNTEFDDNYDVNNLADDETGENLLQQATTNLIASATIAPLTTI